MMTTMTIIIIVRHHLLLWLLVICRDVAMVEATGAGWVCQLKGDLGGC